MCSAYGRANWYSGMLVIAACLHLIGCQRDSAAVARQKALAARCNSDLQARLSRPVALRIVNTLQADRRLKATWVIQVAVDPHDDLGQMKRAAAEVLSSCYSERLDEMELEPVPLN